MTAPNTNPLTYNGYINQIATLAVVTTTTVAGVVQGVDASFNTLIPQMLNYAELRIQRDLDLLPSQVSNTSYSLTASVNSLSVQISDFITLQTISVASGTSQIPLIPTTKEFLQNVYNDNTYTAQPQYFAIYGGNTSTSLNIVVGPYPDQNYNLTLVGTTRLPSLYGYATTANAGTSTTFISTYLPDMLIQASMIYISQFQRNFGPASNDPQMGPTYEAQYQSLLRGALGEEYRKRFEAVAWSSMSASPVATPTAG